MSKRKRKFTEEDRIISAFRSVAGTKDGELVLWTALELSGIMSSTFNENAHTMAYISGRRDTGLELLGYLEKADPTIYPRMIGNNIIRLKAREKEEAEEQRKQMEEENDGS